MSSAAAAQSGGVLPAFSYSSDDDTPACSSTSGSNDDVMKAGPNDAGADDVLAEKQTTICTGFPSGLAVERCAHGERQSRASSRCIPELGHGSVRLKRSCSLPPDVTYYAHLWEQLPSEGESGDGDFADITSPTETGSTADQENGSVSNDVDDCGQLEDQCIDGTKQVSGISTMQSLDYDSGQGTDIGDQYAEDTASQSPDINNVYPEVEVNGELSDSSLQITADPNQQLSVKSLDGDAINDKYKDTNHSTDGSVSSSSDESSRRTSDQSLSSNTPAHSEDSVKESCSFSTGSSTSYDGKASAPTEHESQPDSTPHELTAELSSSFCPQGKQQQLVFDSHLPDLPYLLQYGMKQMLYPAHSMAQQRYGALRKYGKTSMPYLENMPRFEEQDPNGVMLNNSVDMNRTLLKGQPPYMSVQMNSGPPIAPSQPMSGFPGTSMANQNGFFGQMSRPFGRRGRGGMSRRGKGWICNRARGTFHNFKMPYGHAFQRSRARGMNANRETLGWKGGQNDVDSRSPFKRQQPWIQPGAGNFSRGRSRYRGQANTFTYGRYCSDPFNNHIPAHSYIQPHGTFSQAGNQYRKDKDDLQNSQSKNESNLNMTDAGPTDPTEQSREIRVNLPENQQIEGIQTADDQGPDEISQATCHQSCRSTMAQQNDGLHLASNQRVESFASQPDELHKSKNYCSHDSSQNRGLLDEQVSSHQPMKQHQTHEPHEHNRQKERTPNECNTSGDFCQTRGPQQQCEQQSDQSSDQTQHKGGSHSQAAVSSSLMSDDVSVQQGVEVLNQCPGHQPDNYKQNMHCQEAQFQQLNRSGKQYSQKRPMLGSGTDIPSLFQVTQKQKMRYPKAFPYKHRYNSKKQQDRYLYQDGQHTCEENEQYVDIMLKLLQLQLNQEGNRQLLRALTDKKQESVASPQFTDLGLNSQAEKKTVYNPHCKEFVPRFCKEHNGHGGGVNSFTQSHNVQQTAGAQSHQRSEETSEQLRQDNGHLDNTGNHSNQQQLLQASHLDGQKNDLQHDSYLKTDHGYPKKKYPENWQACDDDKGKKSKIAMNRAQKQGYSYSNKHKCQQQWTKNQRGKRAQYIYFLDGQRRDGSTKQVFRDNQANWQWDNYRHPNALSACHGANVDVHKRMFSDVQQAGDYVPNFSRQNHGFSQHSGQIKSQALQTAQPAARTQKNMHIENLNHCQLNACSHQKNMVKWQLSKNQSQSDNGHYHRCPQAKQMAHYVEQATPTANSQPHSIYAATRTDQGRGNTTLGHVTNCQPLLQAHPLQSGHQNGNLPAMLPLQSPVFVGPLSNQFQPPVNSPCLQPVHTPLLQPVHTPMMHPLNATYPQQNVFQFPPATPVLTYGPQFHGPSPVADVFQFPDVHSSQVVSQVDGQQPGTPQGKRFGFAGNQPMVHFPPTPSRVDTFVAASPLPQQPQAGGVAPESASKQASSLPGGDAIVEQHSASVS